MLRQMERSAIHLLAKRGKSQRQIARELGHSRTTIARALQEPVDQKAAARSRASLTDAFQAQIEQWVREDLTSVRMLELARADPDHPYTGGRSVWGEAVRRIRLAIERTDADVPVRFEGLPGEYLQVDWGEIRQFPFTQQRRATRYFLACRLKYSRWSWVRWTSDMRQETLLRGLVDCFVALGFVPWVLVFDNMKTVTTGRDAADQPVWHPALLQLAQEFDFHPEACAIAAGNQKGSVESLVKWVKGNFLPGRSFAEDADLSRQATAWTTQANARPSQATNLPPVDRLPQEAAKGSRLPASAQDYGFLLSAQVSREAFVHVHGNTYSVPLAHASAPVTVRLHRERVSIWRDAALLAEHRRAPDGAQRRVVKPEHFAPQFPQKPRAQVMLYRQALLELGESAASYISELSRRRRDRLGPEVLAVYDLGQQHGTPALLAAMTQAAQVGAYGAEYLGALLSATTPAGATAASLLRLPLPGVPQQAELDRQLSVYEACVVGAPAAAAAGVSA
jgi:transposase